jgi:hypothetical protein
MLVTLIINIILQYIQYRVFNGKLPGKARENNRPIKIKDVNQINLAQDTVQWRALVNAIMNLWIP